MAIDPNLLPIQAHYNLQLGLSPDAVVAALQKLHPGLDELAILEAVAKGQEMMRALPQPFLPEPTKSLEQIAPWIKDIGETEITSRVGITTDTGEQFGFPFRVTIDPAGMTAGELEAEILTQLEEARKGPADGHTVGGVIYTILSLIQST